MRNLRKSGAAEFEDLLRGKAPSLDGSGEALAVLVEQARRISDVPPHPSVEERHLSAILQEAQLFVEKGDPVVRPVSNALGPDFQDSLLPKRRRRFMLGSLLSSLSAKLAAGGVAVALATTGGLAATGELPDPVQDKIAAVAHNIGLEIPQGDEVEEDIDLEAEGELEEPSSLGAGKRSNFDVHEAMESTNTATPRGQIISEAARRKPGDETQPGGGVSADVHAAINSTEPGPQRGKAVSEAASQKRQDGDDEAPLVEETPDSLQVNAGGGPGHGRGANRGRR